MPLPSYTAAVAVRAAHAKCLQSGKFLIGAEIASGIDVMNGISRQPMGKFDMPPSPPSSPRAIGIKISGGRKRRRKSLQKLWHIKDINKKMAAKTRQKSERGKIEMEMEMENVAR